MLSRFFCHRQTASWLFFSLFFIGSQMLVAQDCGCDHIVSQGGVYGPASLGSGAFFLDIAPGETICIAAGKYEYFRFLNFSGAPGAPITIKNCGGLVKIGHGLHPPAIGLERCQYIRLTGTGDESLEHGIRIDSSGVNSAVVITNLSTDVEVDHLEIAAAGFAGIIAKTDPTCNPATWRENFTMRNVDLHDNFIHDTHGEGIYAGFTSCEGVTENCGGQPTVLYAHTIIGLKIHHNRIENAWADCLQYACAPDADVHDNVLLGCGLHPFNQYQVNGIQCGSGAGGSCRNNIIRDTRGMGIIVLGHLGGNRFFNNLIADTGGDGIFADDLPSSLPNTDFDIVNNTIARTGRDAIRLYNPNNRIRIWNNALLQPASGKFIVFQQGATADERCNFKSASLAAARCEDEVSFRPKITSPLVNAGTDCSVLDVASDLENQPRPLNGRFDIGALERQLEAIEDSPSDVFLEKMAAGEAAAAPEKHLRAWRAGDAIFFENTGAGGQAALLDMAGKVVRTFEVPPGAGAFSIAAVGLSSGVYLFEIRAGGQRAMLKIAL